MLLFGFVHIKRAYWNRVKSHFAISSHTIWFDFWVDSLLDCLLDWTVCWTVC